MKKHVITTLAALSLVACTLSFAACGDNSNKDNKPDAGSDTPDTTVYTVTKSEWESIVGSAYNFTYASMEMKIDGTTCYYGRGGKLYYKEDDNYYMYERINNKWGTPQSITETKYNNDTYNDANLIAMCTSFYDSAVYSETTHEYTIDTVTESYINFKLKFENGALVSVVLQRMVAGSPWPVTLSDIGTTSVTLPPVD